ncbi:hypothetical protein N7499_004511 [Penicillium canescens]|uniref:Hydrophobin n=1 Tax=Penicillium canescens TaxID=5083 RepID=A0AAD6I989_PENCN|nr:uncharacterized protein N7446_005139 [Penicillium canescens]KAJ6010085.1 hypothetical protein N7522_005101 [Penicillium canescens]KAJ6038336.1 hypothetical protein N7460_008107 [Penicillium canescens]KAJ6039547.1 hypothetical protein N7444_008452 [Penicillium canescens]KAJ6068102.1 hypothetical protein N7446_005139 [Penicillium canescens]KAJ6084882.1 hypothetical protein N7499_004511 [Penicillium canescens]
MRFSVLSVLSLVGAGMVSAMPQDGGLMQRDSKCIKPILCCGTLTTPLDTTVDPILEELGVNAAEIVGSIGLACHAYEAGKCDNAPQCCSEANLLGGTVALGCADLE